MASKGNEAGAVAIVGMACRLPQAANYREYWQRLTARDNCISEVPADRWGSDAREEGSPESGAGRWGGFIDDIDKFDAQFFGLSAREAAITDPQYRIMLEQAWTCLEDAGYRAGLLDGKDVGVYLGVCNYDYKELYDKHSTKVEPQFLVGNAVTYLANRISHFFNFSGPSICIDTACSSSLVAIHQAAAAVARSECGLALAGGVNVMASHDRHIHFERLGVLSEDGQCYSFDARANGYVRGEGAGIVLLKPLDQAIEDDDSIYGVIKGSAVNHVGKARSITSPSTFAQSAVIDKAIRAANISTDTITHIEAHGTGTPLGDPIEISALKRVFARNRSAQKGKRTHGQSGVRCAVGTAKANIGHLESAAGVAGLIKVLLSMKYGQLPALQNFTHMNEKIKLDDTPLFLVTELQDWPRISDEHGTAIPRRAGISSFGLGGTNAHLIVEEFLIDTDSLNPETADAREHAVLMSANTVEQLRQYAKDFRAFLAGEPAGGGGNVKELSSIAYTSQVSRSPKEHRLAVLCTDTDDLADKLAKFVAMESLPTEIKVGEVSGRITQMFGSDQEDVEYLTQLRANRNLHKLASLWVQGVEVQWDLLHLERKNRRRCRLPTYPFRKIRHWLPMDKPDTVLRNQDAGASDHQLVETGAVEFYTTVQEHDWYMDGHRVGGVATLPGVASIEMVRAAIESVNENRVKVIILKNVVWERPIQVSGASVEVRIELNQPVGQGTFIMTTTGHATDALIHARGGWEVTGPDHTLSVVTTGDDCPTGEKMSVANIYQGLADSGIVYSEHFKLLESVHTSDNNAVTQLARPAPSLAESGKLHIGLMDAALHGILALPALRQHEGRWVPAAVERVEILGPVSGRCRVLLRQIESDRLSHVTSLEIRNDAGITLVRMIGLRLRNIGSSATVAPTATVVEVGTGKAVRSDQRQSLAATPINGPSITIDRLETSETSTVRIDDLLGKLVTQIKSDVATVSGLDVQGIDADQAFSNYGIDSITGLDLLDRLNTRWGLRMKPLVLFDYSTIAKMAAHIAEAHGDRLEVGVEPNKRVDHGIEDILRDLQTGNLSTDDVLAKLESE